MKKSILKRFLVFSMCMSLFGGIVSSNVSNAKSIQGDWSLYFNPSSSSATWLLTVDTPILPVSSTGTIYVSSLTKGATVAVKVVNYTGECWFTKAGSTNVYNIPTNHTQYLRARFTDYKNVITKAKGNIKI